MSRAYVVYFVMFGALIGGLLLILTMGDSVRAPDDLSGDWVVEWDNAPPPESAEPRMHVDQSGRFFVVTFGRRPPMSMTLKRGWVGAASGRKIDMTLARPLWELHVSGAVPMKEHALVPELKLELVGPTRHVGVARRVGVQTASAAPAPAPSREPVKASAQVPVESPNAR
jgi:hypothetical protein